MTQTMSKVIASATVSLDGFIADESDQVGPLFDWYEAGGVEVRNAGDLPPFHLTEASAEYWRDCTSALGCLVVGRHLFDITDGWRGIHPLDVPFVVDRADVPACALRDRTSIEVAARRARRAFLLAVMAPKS